MGIIGRPLSYSNMPTEAFAITLVFLSNLMTSCSDETNSSAKSSQKTATSTVTAESFQLLSPISTNFCLREGYINFTETGRVNCNAFDSSILPPNDGIKSTIHVETGNIIYEGGLPNPTRLTVAGPPARYFYALASVSGGCEGYCNCSVETSVDEIKCNNGNSNPSGAALANNVPWPYCKADYRSKLPAFVDERITLFEYVDVNNNVLNRKVTYYTSDGTLADLYYNPPLSRQEAIQRFLSKNWSAELKAECKHSAERETSGIDSSRPTCQTRCRNALIDSPDLVASLKKAMESKINVPPRLCSNTIGTNQVDCTSQTTYPCNISINGSGLCWTNPTPPGGGCHSNAYCPKYQVCQNSGICAYECKVSTDCPKDNLGRHWACDSNGLCLIPSTTF